MAAVRGPALSLSARGALAKTLVYSSWKGIPVARHYVVPSNPKSAGQVTQRGFMTAAVTAWHGFTALALQIDYDAWRLRAAQIGPMSGFNAFAKEWIDADVAAVPITSYFQRNIVSDPTHNSFDLTIHDSAGAANNCDFYGGATPGFQALIASAVEVAGLRTVANYDTGLPAGAAFYYYFLNTVSHARSGLYRTLLT